MIRHWQWKEPACDDVRCCEETDRCDVLADWLPVTVSFTGTHEHIYPDCNGTCLPGSSSSDLPWHAAASSRRSCACLARAAWSHGWLEILGSAVSCGTQAGVEWQLPARASNTDRLSRGSKWHIDPVRNGLAGSLASNPWSTRRRKSNMLAATILGCHRATWRRGTAYLG